MKTLKTKAILLILLAFFSLNLRAAAGGKQQPPARANVEIQQHKPTPIFSWFNWFNFS